MLTLSRLSLGNKLAVTLFLISVVLGFGFGHSNMKQMLQSKDGEPGVSILDIQYFFTGVPDRPRLQPVLNDRVHRDLIPAGDRETLVAWAVNGVPVEEFDDTIAPVLQARCVQCHGPEGAQSYFPVATPAELRPYAEPADTGIDYQRLAELSSIYTLVTASILGLLCALFLATRFEGAWKELLVFLPFVALLINVLSWWSTKQAPLFAHIIMASGLIGAVLVAAVIVMIFLDMWILPDGEGEG
jgi:hypothetical protein